MDGVSRTLNVVMETGSAQMAVMNSIVVSIVLFCMFVSPLIHTW